MNRALPVSAIVFAMVVGCQALPQEEEADFEVQTHAMRTYVASISIILEGDWIWGEDPTGLHFCFTSGCYALTDPVELDWNIRSWTISLGDIVLGVDHPFVDHPDDWDDPFLYNGTFEDHMLSHIQINHSSVTSGEHNEYMFIDKAGTFPLAAFDDLQLGSLIQEQRVATLEAVAGVSINDLPLKISSAARDLGQVGQEKYTGPLWSETQYGCDEFCGYYAWHFNEDSYKSVVHHQCGGGTWFGADQVCIRYNTDAVPSPWVMQNTVDVEMWPKNGFLQHGLLSKVRFAYDSSGTRIAMLGISMVSSDPAFWDWELDEIPIARRSYNPVPGDVIWRVNNCVGGGHTMMLVDGDLEFDDGELYAKVINLWYSMVLVEEFDLGANWTCTPPDQKEAIPQYSYYIGHLPNRRR